MQNTEVVIVQAVRTPIGNFLGGLSSLKADQLGSIVIKELLNRTSVQADDIDEVILGQVLNAGQGQNPARQASLNAGLSTDTPAWGVSQVCGSGLRAIALAYQQILCGDATIVIAGGQESMSQSHHSTHLRNGTKMGNNTLADTMLSDGLTDAFANSHMGITAENVAKKFNLSRQEQDTFAANSQTKAENAQKEGKFNDEIVPVTITHRKGKTIIDSDEFPRHGTTEESLAKLRPAFSQEGTVTAGNASGINDGAAAILLMTKQEADKRGLTPLATIASWAHTGVEPEIMGTGPISAVKKALSKANWSVNELDLIEANEAFASQSLAVAKELGLNKDIVNVNGGAIALGHPIGASGARILVTLLHEMKRRKARKGVATLCIGGGMGIALCVQQ